GRKRTRGQQQQECDACRDLNSARVGPVVVTVRDGSKARPHTNYSCFGAGAGGFSAGGVQRWFSVGVNSVLIAEPLTFTVNVFSAGGPSTPSTVKRTVRSPSTV